MSEYVFILAEAVAGALVLVGAFFLFVGSFGLAKLPGLMRRLHAPTKATTLGIGSTLIASMLWFGLVRGDPSFHELMITLFLFLTAPVSAQMLAKAQILRSRETQAQLPAIGCDAAWATLPGAVDPTAPPPV